MIIGNNTAAAYPFTEQSTMQLSNTGIKLPAERVTGASLYPEVNDYTLLHMRRLDKTEDYIKLTIVNDSDDYLFDIYFALSDKCPHDVPVSSDDRLSVGYAVQNGGLCGCLLGDSLLLKLLNALPDTEFDLDAFIFSPSVCFLRIVEKNPVGKLLYAGKEVNEIRFNESPSETLIGDESVGYTINTNAVNVYDRIVSIKSIYINGCKIENMSDEPPDVVYIQAGKDSGIRVLTEETGITIGRFSEL